MTNGVVNHVCVHGFAFKIEIVVGGTHLESNFVASNETLMCMSTASLESTLCEGLMHLCFLAICSVERFDGCASRRRGETGSPPLKSSGLLYELWLLQRKRDCTPSSSHFSRWPLRLRRRKDWHLSVPPHIVQSVNLCRQAQNSAGVKLCYIDTTERRSLSCLHP